MAVTSSPGTATRKGLIAGWLSPAEFRILEAVCDTFFPSLEPPAGSSETLATYYRRSADDLPVALLVAETLAQENAESQAQFRQLLGLMASPVFGLMLAGSPRPFVDLPHDRRAKYLLSLANS